MAIRFCVICNKQIDRSLYTTSIEKTICSAKCYTKLREYTPEIYWSKVNKQSDNNCWEWLGGVKPNGYGVIRYKRANWYAHRLAYFLTYGEIPKDLQINHHCDNRKCCNPSHLYAGTHKDNTQDMIRRGRHHPRKGEGTHSNKLTEQQVIFIRQQANTKQQTRKALAKQFGVSITTIQAIVHKKKWKYLLQPEHIDTAI